MPSGKYPPKKSVTARKERNRPGQSLKKQPYNRDKRVILLPKRVAAARYCTVPHTFVNMERKFSQEFVIQSPMVDFRKNLRAVSFMSMCQEMAYTGAERLGFGYSSLDRHHTAWVLARMNIRFNSLPQWQDTVTLTTWHKGMQGPFFLRDFELSDATGRIVVAATSSWVVIDSIDRHMLRSDHLTLMQDFSGPCESHAIEQPASKVVMPKGVPVDFVTEHTVQFSDIDFIGHTNNTRYLEWAIDCIPPKALEEYRVSEITINYNQESHWGDTVTLSHTAADNLHSIEGSSNGRQIFIAGIRLA